MSRRRGVVLPALLASLLAAAFVVAALAVTGSLGGGTETVTTTVREGTTTQVSDRSGGSGLDAEALYTETAAGVVEITATESGSGGEGGFGPGEGTSPFGEPSEPGVPSQPESSEATATGAGFVIDGEGDIVTAAHVVDEATSVEVTFEDGTSRKATVLGTDDATDVAVIKVDASGLSLDPLELGSSSALNVGAEVAAIGTPFGYAGSISTGIVSGLDRTIEAPNGFTVAHAIQTDAAVNPGNSGGPLLNAAGEVIGVVDQIATSGEADQGSGVGFAVPSDLVSSEVEALIGGEEVEHAYLGVATATESGSTQGALVQQVVSGGPAAEAGLRSGDVITAIDGTAVAGSDDLVAAIAEYEPGDEVTLKVKRDSETLSLKVTFGSQPAESSLG